MTASPITAWLEDHRPDYLLVRTEIDGACKDLYFRADRPVWHTRPQVLDFVAVALAQHAANLRRDLHIRGRVTTSQLANLAEYLQIWSTWKPDCFQNILISCDEEMELPKSQSPAALAFSGGVDSSYSLLAHNRKMLGRLSVPVGIGVLVVGWDLRHGDQRAADVALRRAEKTLAEFGSQCVAISTNWQQDFCPVWFLGFNAGVACILQTLRNDCSCAIFASSVSYKEELTLGPFGSHIAVNHLLGSTSFPFLTCGGTHTRLERIAAISKHPILMSELRVCYQEGAGGSNCCHCEKCARTQLEFIAVGIDPSISFSECVTEADVERIHAVSLGALALLEEVLARFPTDHKLRPALIRTVEHARKSLTADSVNNGRQMEEQQKLIASLKEEVASLQNSTSWKVTKPLRQLKLSLMRSRKTTTTDR